MLEREADEVRNEKKYQCCWADIRLDVDGTVIAEVTDVDTARRIQIEAKNLTRILKLIDIV